MSNDPTPEQVRASIVARSEQVNADDLLAGPLTVTVTKVSKGDKEQPIHIDLEQCPGKSYRPCKTMRRVLIAAWSDDPKKWVGQRMTLYTDPDVMYAGIKVGGIRISHMTGLENPRTFMLTQTRGKKAEVTIHPLQADASDQIKAALVEIGACKTVDELKAVGTGMKKKPKSVQDAVRDAYASALAVLKANSPVAKFEAEIEAAKDSRKALTALAARCDEFGDEGKRLYNLIDDHFQRAVDDTEN